MPNRDKTQSIESRPAPRRSESSVSQTQPAIKVVGFRVEGAAPSPSPPSTLLADSQRADGNVTSGSPNPVIIPPSFQTDSPVGQAAARRSGDAPAVQHPPIARQRTAPVLVPGSLTDSSHLQDPSILVTAAPRAHTNNPRDATSPAQTLMLSSAVSLPPVAQLTGVRSEIESAVTDSAGPLQLSTAGGRQSVPASPRQQETPTLHQRPTSPFATQSAFAAQIGPEHFDVGEGVSEQHALPNTRSMPSSPLGTPGAAHRQASFSHHPSQVPSTVAAAAATLGVNASFSTDSRLKSLETDVRRRSIDPLRRSIDVDRINSDSGTGFSTPAATGPKQDLEIPPPPLQPVHQSASAAELAAKVKEAEQQSDEELDPQQSTTHQPHRQQSQQQPQQQAKQQAKQQQPKQQQQQPSQQGAGSQDTAVGYRPQQTAGGGVQKPQASKAAEPQAAKGVPSQDPSRLQKEAKQEAQKPKGDASQAKKGQASSAARPLQDGQDQDKPKSTKAERRAKQEAERAAKAAGAPKGGAKQSHAGAKQGQASSTTDKQATASTSAQAQTPAQPQGAAATKGKPAKQASKVQQQQQQKAAADGQATGLPSDVFAHLPQYKRVTLDSVLEKYNFDFPFHPEVLKLGLRYADGSIKGANARCIAMLDMLRQMVEDYTTPAGKVLSRDLTQQLNNAIQFLVHCRPLSISMGNAIKYVKLQISKIDPAAHESDAKEELVEKINTYIQEKIVFADSILVTNAVAKVYNDDVILTYGFSSVIFNILLRASKEGKKFRVVVMDSRPQLEGRALLRRLLSHGIACSYVLLNSASYIMQEVTKVFLGAAAVLSNGTVMSRAGSAAVAMMASASSKPVIICCETFKFHEKVQLDSITSNELGDPSALTKVARRPDITALQDWEEQPRLGLLNLTYDAMPQDYITLVVTEFGAIPPTSVPVILREYRQEPTI